jgi:hypothetical protein
MTSNPYQSPEEQGQSPVKRTHWRRLAGLAFLATGAVIAGLAGIDFMLVVGGEQFWHSQVAYDLLAITVVCPSCLAVAALLLLNPFGD